MMNIKKQLRKIRDYVEVLEISEDQLTEELRQYQLTAHKFVKFEITMKQAQDEFKALLGDTTFVGGNFIDVWSGDNWKAPHQDIEHDQTMTLLKEENARLHEQLRWRDAKLEPPTKSGYYFTKQLGGIIDITYYNYTSTYGWECDNKVLKWMPIPEDGEA